MQVTSQLLMISPLHFGFNAQTAINNSFQQKTGEDTQQEALAEFEHFVTVLKQNNLDIIILKDLPHPVTPDAIFPNNWVSFHEDNSMVLYPMFAANRRSERRNEILSALIEKIIINRIDDLTHYENKNYFLEGTGSMVLDRKNKIAYACLSARTSLIVLHEFCSLKSYKAITFNAHDIHNKEIYHTNVLMCIAENYAVICSASIRDKNEREKVIISLKSSGKEIIDISMQQLHCFAGNMLQVISKKNELLLLMSDNAYDSLDKEQVSRLEFENRIIHAPLHTIEHTGGGSARCMIAEIFNEIRP